MKKGSIIRQALLLFALVGTFSFTPALAEELAVEPGTLTEATGSSEIGQTESTDQSDTNSLMTTDTKATEEAGTSDEQDSGDLAIPNRSRQQTATSYPQGEPIPITQYVTIKKRNYTVWENFEQQALTTTNSIINQTFKVNFYYKHQNGSKYYALYDANNKLFGYLNANATEGVAGPQGAWQKTNEFVTIIKNNGTIWQNFNWKGGKPTKNRVNKTYHAKGYYTHMNGSKYYSLYDNQGKWLGYLNAKETKSSNGRQGAFLPTNRYVTITNANYPVWQNFNWKKRTTTKNMVNKTYLIKGYYSHLSGQTYYSLYDDNGKWQGYLNAKVAKNAPGAYGIGFSLNKYVTVSSPNYPVWSNFNWKKRTTTKNMVNKPFQIKRMYRHANGSLYYSLYANNKWQGYLNATAVKEVKGNNSTFVLLNAPFINQYAAGAPMGCEAASLLEAFRVKGYAPKHNLKKLLNEMPLSKNNNPHNGFAGSPWTVTYGIFQSIFASPLAKWGNTYAAGKVVNMSGSSTKTLKNELKKGNPLVVYVTLDFQKPVWGSYHWGNGVNNSHIMTLDGYNSQTNQYHVADPYRGKYWVSAKKFEASFKTTKGAVVIR